MQYMRKIQINSVVMMLISILFSCLLINIFLRCGLEFDYLAIGILDVEGINEAGFLSVVLAVVLKRLKQFLIIFLLMKVVNSDFIYSIIIVILSMVFGVMLTIQTFYIGFNGVIILLLSLFPHYVLYILIIKLLHQYSLNTSSEKGKINFILSFLMFFTAGVICENYFSTFFLQKFYQYIVIL